MVTKRYSLLPMFLLSLLDMHLRCYVIALYKSTFTYLLTYLLTLAYVNVFVKHFV